MRLLAFISLMTYSGIIFVYAKESVRFGRIIRGHDTMVNKFPYVVRLSAQSKNSKYRLCAGALISPTWVLTAAHCVENFKSVKVYLGSTFFHQYKVAYVVSISDITIHPDFRSRYLYHDIALIKIPPTKMGQKIATIRLPKIGRIRVIHPYPKSKKVYAKICGWGRTSMSGNNSRRLQWGRVQILGREHCPHITRDELCTAMSSNLATTCFGDSGGPLVLETTGELIGIASTADGRDCENGLPAKFTRITSYLNWIKSVCGIAYM